MLRQRTGRAREISRGWVGGRPRGFLLAARGINLHARLTFLRLPPSPASHLSAGNGGSKYLAEFSSGLRRLEIAAAMSRAVGPAGGRNSRNRA